MSSRKLLFERAQYRVLGYCRLESLITRPCWAWHCLVPPSGLMSQSVSHLLSKFIEGLRFQVINSRAKQASKAFIPSTKCYSRSKLQKANLACHSSTLRMLVEIIMKSTTLALHRIRPSLGSTGSILLNYLCRMGKRTLRKTTPPGAYRVSKRHEKVSLLGERVKTRIVDAVCSWLDGTGTSEVGLSDQHSVPTPDASEICDEICWSEDESSDDKWKSGILTPASSDSAEGLRDEKESTRFRQNTSQKAMILSRCTTSTFNKDSSRPTQLDTLPTDIIYEVFLLLDTHEDIMNFALSSRTAATVFSRYSGSIFRTSFSRSFSPEAFALMQMSREGGISPVADAYISLIGRINYRFSMRPCRSGLLSSNRFSFGQNEVKRLKTNRNHVERLVRQYLYSTHLHDVGVTYRFRRYKTLLTYPEWSDTFSRLRFVFYFLLEMGENFHLRDFREPSSNAEFKKMVESRGSMMFDYTRLLQQPFQVLVDILWICKRMIPNYWWSQKYAQLATDVLQGVLHRLGLTEREQFYDSVIWFLSSGGDSQGLRICTKDARNWIGDLEHKYYYDGRWQLPEFFVEKSIITVDGNSQIVTKKVVTLGDLEGAKLPSIKFLEDWC